MTGAGFLKRPSPGFATGSNDIRLPKRICWAIGNLSKTYKNNEIDKELKLYELNKPLHDTFLSFLD